MAVFTEAEDAGGAVGVGTPDHAAPQRPFYVKISRPLDWYSVRKPVKMYTWAEPITNHNFLRLRIHKTLTLKA
jgi:hypothetical protein